MSKQKKMIQIEEEGSQEMEDQSELDTPRGRRLTLNEFDWFEFQNRARKLMSEMLEPIYQRQTDARTDIKDIRKFLEVHKKRMDEQDFLMHKQAKRIDGVERIWEKLNTMEQDRKSDENKITADISQFKQEYQGTKYQVDRQAGAHRDLENKVEKQVAELGLAQNMILDMRQGLAEQIKGHLENTTTMYQEMSHTLLSIQDRITEFDARANAFKKQQDEIAAKIQFHSEETKRAKEIAVETNKIVESKVELENYKQAHRLIQNDLRVMEESLKYRAKVLEADGEKRLSEVSEYLQNYFPIDVQKIVSDTLMKVLSRKKDLVRLIETDKERFSELRNRIAPQNEEEQAELLKVQDNFDKESEKRRKQKGGDEAGGSGEKLKTLPQEEEDEKSEKERHIAAPVMEKKEVKIVDLLKEKRRESVSFMLSKINMKVDEKLREEMEKEEEEWENIKKGIAVADDSDSDSYTSSDSEKNQDKTYTSKMSSVDGSERKRGDFVTKQFSEDAEEEKAAGKPRKKKNKKKKHKKSKDDDPFEGALLMGSSGDNPGFFRKGRGSFVSARPAKKKKKAAKKLLNQDDRIQEDPESLRDSGSYTQALSKSSFKKTQSRDMGHGAGQENMSTMSKRLSSRDESIRQGNRSPLLKTLSKATQEDESAMESKKERSVTTSRSPPPEAKQIQIPLPSELNRRSTVPLSHVSSIRSGRSGKQSSIRRASRFTPAPIRSNDEQEPEEIQEGEEMEARQMSLYGRTQRGEVSEAVQGSGMGRYTGVVTQNGSMEEIESLEQLSMEGSIESKPRPPIKVHDVIQLGPGIASHSASYASILKGEPVKAGIDEEQLDEYMKEYLQGYVKEETVQERIEAAKEELESQFNEQMEEIETNMGEHLKEQFKHLREVTGSKLKETDMKFKTATDDMKYYVQNIENEVEGWLKKEKRTNNDKYGDLNHITEQIDKAARNTENVLSALENVASLLACMVEHGSILSALISQDDEDKKNIALVGYRENFINTSTNALQSSYDLPMGKLPSVTHVSKKSFSPKSSRLNKSYHTMSPRSIAGEQSPRGAGSVVPDKNCLSCSGNKQVVMQAFKLACLAYAPGVVSYRGKSFTREDLRAMAHCITDACNDMINKQVPFTIKEISTKRYFDDMFIQIKLNEKSMLKKVHPLDMNPSLGNFLTQVVNTSLPKIIPDPSGSLDSFHSSKVSPTHRKSKDRMKSTSLLYEPKPLGVLPPPPVSSRNKPVKHITLGGSVMSKSALNESSNESLPLISPKRMASPRP